MKQPIVHTWEPTCELRAKKTKRKGYILEQKWVCLETQDEEWRGIPRYEE